MASQLEEAQSAQRLAEEQNARFMASAAKGEGVKRLQGAGAAAVFGDSTSDEGAGEAVWADPGNF